MSNYSALKTDINNNIYENNTQQITGTILNTVLKDMVNTLGAGYQFAGCAYLDLNPGAPDAKVFYLAGEGLYTNFDNIQVPAGKLGILKWDTRWRLETIEGLGGGGANLTGYISVASTDDLPDEGQPTIGYLCGTNLYLYVGEGGDTKEGKYQDCGAFRGPEGVGITEIEQVEQSTENGGRNTIRIHLSNGSSYDVYTRNGTTSTGLFPTLEALQAAYPSPVVGQYAFVGAGFPADIYVCNTAGTWTDSGADYDGDSVDLTNYATKAELNQLEAKVTDLDEQINGKNEETIVTATYNYGYIGLSNGVIGGRSNQTTYQYTDAIELTDDVHSIKLYGIPYTTATEVMAAIGFYTISALPISSGQAARTIGVLQSTQSGADNVILEVPSEKIAEMKAGGAHYFSVCVLATGTKGISYFTVVRGIVGEIEDLETRADGIEQSINALGQSVDERFEDTIVLEDEVTNYGLYATTLTNKYYDEDGTLIDWDAYNSCSLCLLDKEHDIYPYFNGSMNYVVFFDKDKNFISRAVGCKTNAPVLKSTFPATAKYVAFSWIKTDLIPDVFATRNEYIRHMGWKVYCTFKKKKGTRPSVEILPTDTEGEILLKLCSAYIAGDCDVKFNYGNYALQSIYADMVSTYEVGSVQGSYQRELPLGRNCTYDLCNSTITGSMPSGVSDAKVFGNMRQAGESYKIMNGKIVNNGMVYAIHDEGQNAAGFYKHEYENLEIVNDGGIAAIGLGTGISGVVNVGKCIFRDSSTNPGIGGHGITDSSVTDVAVFELNISNCWFSTSANVTTLGVNQTAKLVMAGCSVKSLYAASTWEKIFFCNEVRS